MIVPLPLTTLFTTVPLVTLTCKSNSSGVSVRASSIVSTLTNTESLPASIVALVPVVQVEPPSVEILNGVAS